MVRVPALGIEYGCFRSACGGLQYFDGRGPSPLKPMPVTTGVSAVEFNVSVDGFPERGRSDHSYANRVQSGGATSAENARVTGT